MAQPAKRVSFSIQVSQGGKIHFSFEMKCTFGRPESRPYSKQYFLTIHEQIMSVNLNMDHYILTASFRLHLFNDHCFAIA